MLEGVSWGCSGCVVAVVVPESDCFVEYQSSGKRRIKTGRAGVVKVKAKATDELRNKAKKSCRVKVTKR